jgi:acyl-CoA synthetase (AMP-forming)/AMP-acid ligase II
MTGKYSPNIMANSFISCATHNPSGEVIVHGKRRITWAEHRRRIFKMADAFVGIGVKKNDKVAFMFHNSPEFMETNWAIQVAGGIPAPMNYRFVPKEVEYQANHSDAHVLIYDSLWADAVEPAATSMPQVAHFVCKGESSLPGAIDYEAFVGSGNDRDPQVETDWPDVAVIIYTGGTTGFPKGVLLTYEAHVGMFSVLFAQAIVRALTMDMSVRQHKSMMEYLPIPAGKLIGPVFRTKFVKNLFKRPGAFEFFRKKTFETFSDPDAARKGYGKTRRAMFPSMPFFHDAAYANLVMGSLAGNICYVLPESISFDPALVLELVEREQITNMSNVPTGWQKLVSFPGASKYDLGSLQMAVTGGGACSAKLKKQILAMFPNCVLMDAFGQTEMTPVTSFRLDADPDRIEDRSVGRAIVEARVVDENGNNVAPGGIGEILYRSSTVMKGYYKDEEKTHEVMADGWFKSGDLGYFDETGEIRTVDRKKECINTGGEKVFPLEVEEIVRNHPKVEDVCVIGVPDPEWGSSIRAVVALKKGEAAEASEIIGFCRGQMAGYKIPRSVVFVEELPRSPVGKMLRQQVRNLYGEAAQ